jgi:hypothetical protein
MVVRQVFIQPVKKLLLEANVPAKVVQDVLGHADVTLTLNTYD